MGMAEGVWMAVMGVWSGLIAGLFGVVMWLLNRPQHEAAAKKAEVQVYGTMLATMERMAVVLEQKELRLDKLEQRQDELERLNQQKDQRIAELEALIAELQGAMAAKDQQIAHLNQRVISLQAEGEHKDQRMAELQQEIVGLQQQRDDDRRRLDKLQQEKDHLEAEVAQLRGEKEDTVPLPANRVEAVPPSPNLNPLLVLTAPEAALKPTAGSGAL